MLCDRCHKREAAMHYTQIINGRRTEAHLCTECVAGSPMFSGHACGKMDSLFHSLFDESVFRNFWRDPMDQMEKLAWPAGFVTMDARIKARESNGPVSYKILRENLKPFYQKGQNSVPSNEAGAEEPKGNREGHLASAVQELRKQLALLVQEEKYEEAVRLRDEIKRLTAKEDGHDE